MEAQWETVRKYTELHEAQLDRSRLEDAGIPAFIPNEHQFGMRWPFLQSDPLLLQVPEGDLLRAIGILGPEPKRSQDFPCPHCGSERTYWSWESKTGVWLIFLLIAVNTNPIVNFRFLNFGLLGLTLVYFFWWKDKMRCRSCRQSFNRR